jgi:hypothetical protein
MANNVSRSFRGNASHRFTSTGDEPESSGPAGRLKGLLVDVSWEAGGHQEIDPVAALVIELAVAQEKADPDVLPQACFDQLAIAFEDRPHLLPAVFEACSTRTDWPHGQDPAFCRIALLAALLALMPGRPDLKQLAQAQGRVIGLAQCDMLQRALRLTIAALRDLSDPILSPQWAGNKKPLRLPRVDGLSIRSAEDQLLHALAQARVSGEADDVECRREIAVAGSLESWASEWSTSVSDSVEVSRRLMAWCARAVGECQTA